MKPRDYRNRKSSLKSYSHGICWFTFCTSNFSGVPHLLHETLLGVRSVVFLAES